MAPLGVIAVFALNLVVKNAQGFLFAGYAGPCGIDASAGGIEDSTSVAATIYKHL